MAKSVAIMPPPDPGPRPHCSIAPTERGWLLVIQDGDCSVMQVFRTSAAARCAIDRMQTFFDTMKSQGPASRALATY